MKLDDGSTFLLDPVEKAAWIADLKSGDFKQGHTVLIQEDEEGNRKFCCMGVKIWRTHHQELEFIPKNRLAYASAVYHFRGQPGVLTTSILPHEVQIILSAMNDGSPMGSKSAHLAPGEKRTFSQIAVWIDENL